MLEVRLVRISGLRSEDLIGHSDPYVILRVSAMWRRGGGGGYGEVLRARGGGGGQGGKRFGAVVLCLQLRTACTGVVHSRTINNNPASIVTSTACYAHDMCLTWCCWLLWCLVCCPCRWAAAACSRTINNMSGAAPGVLTVHAAHLSVPCHCC